MHSHEDDSYNGFVVFQAFKTPRKTLVINVYTEEGFEYSRELVLWMLTVRYGSFPISMLKELNFRKDKLSFLTAHIFGYMLLRNFEMIGTKKLGKEENCTRKTQTTDFQQLSIQHPATEDK